MKTINTQISDQIRNTKCYSFRFVEGGILILYFKSSDSDTSNMRLWIDCAWRLRKGKYVVVGSMDESSDVLKSINDIIGCTVDYFCLDNDTGDVCLSLSGQYRIETFGYATVDELWEYRRGDGLRIGVGPHYEPYTKCDDPEQGRSGSRLK